MTKDKVIYLGLRPRIALVIGIFFVMVWVGMAFVAWDVDTSLTRALPVLFFFGLLPALPALGYASSARLTPSHVSPKGAFGEEIPWSEVADVSVRRDVLDGAGGLVLTLQDGAKVPILINRLSGPYGPYAAPPDPEVDRDLELIMDWWRAARSPDS